MEQYAMHAPLIFINICTKSSLTNQLTIIFTNLNDWFSLKTALRAFKLTRFGAEASLDFPAFTRHRLIILKYKTEVDFRF